MPDKIISTSREAVREQLARILSSGVFAGSQRMARFLQFTVEETLNGNAHHLKEIVIGAKVFDRDSTYDPRLDPIVRVEARRLRAKLERYYDTKGKHDCIIIELPKGRYSPVFHERSGAPNPARSGNAAHSTIAVLPFTNLDPEKGGEYFSDGLSEELIHALMPIANLRVVAWNSVAQLRDRHADLGTIREQLDVAHVLQGSVRRTGQRLRIAAHLIDTATGHYVWSETYDRHVLDIFAIQQEIANAIATALNLRFWKTGARRPAPATPSSLESYQLCLKGRFHARDRTVEGLKRSQICFEEAIRIDGSSASAYSGLADTYALLADYGFAEGCEFMGKAKTAVERALALDPECAEAHASFGMILTIYDWEWDQGESAFRRALELNPGYVPAHLWYGVDHLALLGRLDEAEIQIEAAIELDPLSSIVLSGRSLLRTIARAYDEAIRQSKAVIELDPSFYKGYTALGRAYLQKGMYAEAIENLDRGRRLGGEIPSILGALGQAHGLAGNISEARHILSQLHLIAESRPVPLTSFALTHLGLGEKEAALGWLERGVARRQSPMASLNVHPAYDSLRQEPRFQALLRTIGFPSYRKITP